jgi:hypothetical protein
MLERLMAKSRDDRFESAEAALDAIAALPAPGIVQAPALAL